MGLFMMIGHVFVIYLGAHFAELEYVDIWRCLVVALISYIVMFVLMLLLSPLLLIPFVSSLFGAIVLLLGTAFASKMVLSCDWQPAWIIGGTAAAANFIVSLIF